MDLKYSFEFGFWNRSKNISRKDAKCAKKEPIVISNEERNLSWISRYHLGEGLWPVTLRAWREE
jgi:hypothetical protein